MMEFKPDIQGRAESMGHDTANVIFTKINAVPDPRFDSANLTPEQRGRYARDQASKA